jgi:hypothetical protein
VIDTDMNAGWLRDDDARFVTGQFLDATGGALLRNMGTRRKKLHDCANSQ